MTSQLTALLAFLFIPHVNAKQNTQITYDIEPSQAWGYGILVGVGLYLIGFLAELVILATKNLFSYKTFKALSNLLYSLGCGAMIGDAMIHILPESYSNSEVNFRLVALIFIISIGVFIGMERLFVICGIAHQHGGDEDHDHSHADQHDHSHGKKQHKDGHHGHKHGEHQCEGDFKVEVQTFEQNLNADSSKKEQDSLTTFKIKVVKKEEVPSSLKIKVSNKEEVPSSLNEFQKNQSSMTDIKKAIETKKLEQQNKKDLDEKKEENEGCLSRYKGKGPAGYLNLLSSFIHNFFEGFAIGTAFASRQKSQYIPTLIAVYAHQIPRQMGDVGILIKSKFNSLQKIFCNGIVNLTSLIGVVLGLALGSISEAVQIYILSFIAGNFIYIGADIWRNLLKNKDFCSNFLQFLSFSLGVGSMYLVLLAKN